MNSSLKAFANSLRQGHILPRLHIPDECGRMRMSWPEFVRHIQKCQKESCREVYRNHLDVLRAYGVSVPAKAKGASAA